MSKKEWYTKPIYLLVALALVLSVGIVALPVAGANGCCEDAWVDDDADLQWYNVTCHFGTIQKGIDAVCLNGTVHVLAGTYAEAVTIDKALTLLGAKAGVDPRGGAWVGEDTVIDPGAGNTGIDIAASNVTVDGFEVTGAMYGIYIGSVDASNATISCCDLHDNSKYGLQAIGLGSDVSFIYVSLNYMHDNDRNGLKLVDVTDCVVDSNEFASNGFGSSVTKPEYKYGVFLEDERYNAALYSPCIRNSFVGNSFHDNALGAINMEVMGNAVGSHWSSMEFLEDTVVRNNNFDGDSSVWGINVDNDYMDDGTQDGFGPIAIVDGTLNWWGDESGPYDPAGTTEVPPCTADPTAEINADGAGCMVSDNVDYCPWLTALAPVGAALWILDDLSSEIGDLLATDFSNSKAGAGQQQALLNKVDAVFEQIEAGAYNGAINKLQNDVRDKIEKWVVDGEQTELIQKVDAIVAILEDLLE